MSFELEYRVLIHVTWWVLNWNRRDMVTFESELKREKNGVCWIGYGDILNGRYGEWGIKKLKGGWYMNVELA